MKKRLTKIFFILILFFAMGLINIDHVYAASVNLDFSKKVVGAGEQFYVDLMLDTEGQSVNTIEGSITFQNDNISFLRCEDGKSMVNLWVLKPALDLDGNTLRFAGVMTNGFDGVIDPFNPDYKLPGLIVRLVFEGKKPGVSSFSTSTFNLNLNDGKGTALTASPFYGSINVGDYVNNQRYDSKIDSLPLLEAYVIRDANVYNNKYVLVFQATDKNTGIKSVKIKEGKRDWVVAESPYLLKDQSRASIIYIQATNNQGASIIKVIEPLSRKFLSIRNITIILIVVLLLAIIARVIWKRYKNKHDH